MNKSYELAIVGAGPLGIECAAACKQVGISYIHFDKAQIGQMISNFPPETRFFSSSERIEIANMPLQTVDQQKCSREHYLAYLRAVVMHYQLNINTFEEVISIKKQNETFLLNTRTASGEHIYEAKFVVLATGGTAFPRMLKISGEHLPHVSSRMIEPHFYFQKNVLIVGHRNSAAEAALRCFHAGAKVTMAVRCEAFDPNHVKYWILPELLSYIEKKRIRCFYQTELIEILPDCVFLRQGNRETMTIPIDFVIKAIGFEADLHLFEQLHVRLSHEQQAPQHSVETMETNIANLFVLGTASAGTQKKYRVFIENCHSHVNKIVKTLCARLGKKAVLEPFSVHESEHPEE